MVDYGANNDSTDNKEEYETLGQLENLDLEADEDELEDIDDLDPVTEDEEFYLTNYPILAITGDFGSGKTLYATFMAIMYHVNEGMNIFSNYKLIGVDYRKVTFKEVAEMPEWLENGVLILDEMQIGADSYKSMSKGVKDLTTFITQIRKRDIILIITTQRFKMVSKRIRLLINFYIEVESVAKGIVKAKTYDLPSGYIFLHERTYNLRDVYPYYNTREVIRNTDEKSTTKKSTKKKTTKKKSTDDKNSQVDKDD